MGRCEFSEASFGIRIKITDLLGALNANNFATFTSSILTEKSFIEDKNGTLNWDHYIGPILNSTEEDCWDTWEEYRQSMDKILEPLKNEYLLCPLFPLVKTDRWGYNRAGANGTSVPFDFGKVQNDIHEIEQFIKTNNFENRCTIVYMISHDAG